MRLFQVTAYAGDIYVLAKDFNDALKAAATDSPIFGSALATVRDLGEPVWASTDPRTAGARLSNADLRKSVTPDALVSFEDGKLYKTLKRHLAGRGLTPVAYREKWGLPPDYPMVAPNYSAVRSALARANGLGRK